MCIYKHLKSFRDTSSQIFNWTLWALSIEPKIPEIFVYTSKVWSDPNIRDQLRRWSTLIDLVISIRRTEVSLSIGKIVIPNTPLLYPAYKNNNQMRGGLRSGLFNRNVPFRWEFPKFQYKFFVERKAPKISAFHINTSSRSQYLSREFICMPMAGLQQLFYQMLHVFSIKNNRATISSSSFTTAPREGLTLRASGISLDFSGNLRFKKEIGWYVS